MDRHNSRRHFLKSATLAAASTLLTPAFSSIAHAGKLGSQSIKNWLIFDGLGTTFDWNMPEQTEEDKKRDPYLISDRVRRDIRNSGLNVMRVTTGEPFAVMPGENLLEKAVQRIGSHHRWIETNSDILMLAKSTQDIFKANKQGRVAILLCFQNSHVLADSVDRVDMFRDLGVLTMQLTYNGRNQLGAGANMGESLELTEFGHQAVAKMNEAKVLIDLSHSNQQTCLDAIKASTMPVTISHSGCRALADFPRNKTDEEMRLLADKGGVFGLYFMPFLAPDSQARAAHLVAHIEHAVKVCGEDHVAIGTDASIVGIDDLERIREGVGKFTQMRIDAGTAAAGEKVGKVNLLPDLSGPDQYVNLARLLEKRGHRASRIEKIFGLNALRIMQEVCEA